jgi:catechol 2,3-dioxygenase-like lactoylglutathione lyase family enzyme
MRLPSPVPEFPVGDVRAASGFYERQMGFRVDWTYEDYLAGISKDAARIFLRKRTPEEQDRKSTALVWLNLDSPSDVDALYDEWRRNDVEVVDELKTWDLREFTVRDPDGNRFRVFCDLGPGR